MSAKTLIDFSNIGVDNDQIATHRLDEEKDQADDLEEEIIF